MIAGGSSGLGLVVAETFVRDGYRVLLVGRSEQKLAVATKELRKIREANVSAMVCDLTNREDTLALAEKVKAETEQLDVLVNCAGSSDRGRVIDLSVQRFHELIDQNVLTALLASQAMLPMLEQSRGSIVNIGSLAGKVGARYLGGYNTAKHAITGLTQQMRLEFAESGVHVALVSPGPIRRDDAGKRYVDRVDNSLPEKAAAPGGGTKVKGLPPQKVASIVLDCAKRKRTDVILPGYLRCLITVGNAFPRLGDWLLLKFT